MRSKAGPPSGQAAAPRPGQLQRPAKTSKTTQRSPKASRARGEEIFDFPADTPRKNKPAPALRSPVALSRPRGASTSTAPPASPTGSRWAAGTVACEGCRTARRKCSKGGPGTTCKTCADAGAECVWPRPPERPGSSSARAPPRSGLRGQRGRSPAAAAAEDEGEDEDGTEEESEEEDGEEGEEEQSHPGKDGNQGGQGELIMVEVLQPTQKKGGNGDGEEAEEEVDETDGEDGQSESLMVRSPEQGEEEDEQQRQVDEQLRQSQLQGRGALAKPSTEQLELSVPKRKRGRPKTSNGKGKRPAPEAEQDETEAPPAKRKRGRPKTTEAKEHEAAPETQEEPATPTVPGEIEALLALSEAEPEDAERINWLGQDELWDSVATAVHQLTHRVHENTIELQTDGGRAICDDLMTAMKHYNDETPELYTDALRKLKSRLRDLQAELAPFHSQKMQDTAILEDLYAHVIPRAVYLVQTCASRFSARYSDARDAEALDEVTLVMSLALSFCEAARSVRAPLETGAPIVGFTSRAIFPYLRAVHDAFRNELKRRRYDQHQRQVEARFDSTVRAKQREQERRATAREDSIERRRRARDEWAAQFLPGPTAEEREPSEPPAPQGGVDEEWTWERDDQLMQCLYRTRSLPSTRPPPIFFSAAANRASVAQRYLECLKCELLQNLHDGLIRKRALELKPALEQYHSGKLGRVPAWVSSIA